MHQIGSIASKELTIGGEMVQDQRVPNSRGCINLHNEGIHTVQIISSGQSRRFELFVPTGLTDGVLTPGIFMWHGYASTPDKVMDFTKINDFAQTEKWIAIYPVGTGLIKGFNGAGCCPGVTANDVQFARDMITYLKNNMCLDESSVFTTGFSNGGFMTHRLACEATALFRGFAVHSGLLGTSFQCSPSQGYPMLLIHGDADGVVPFFGNGQWDSFADSVGRIATLNQCGSEANAYVSLETETSTCIRFESCSNGGHPLEYCSVVGLTHEWSGTRNFDVEFTSRMFDFFKSLMQRKVY